VVSENRWWRPPGRKTFNGRFLKPLASKKATLPGQWHVSAHFFARLRLFDYRIVESATISTGVKIYGKTA